MTLLDRHIAYFHWEIMDQEFLKIVRCPVTNSPLEYADESTLASLNHKIENGKLFNRVGQLVESKITSGLVNADRTLLLPIRGGIAIMVVDQAIVLDA